VSLSAHFCNCVSSISTCKHILAIQLIVKNYHQYLNDEDVPSSSAIMDHAVLLKFEEVDNKGISSDCIPYNGEGDEFLQIICEIMKTYFCN